MRVSLKRRSVLVAGGTAGLCALAAPILWRRRQRRRALLVEDPELRAARDLGRWYLGRHPEDGDTAALEELLLGSARARWDRRQLAQVWQQACREDFRAGQVVDFDGWSLARTEGRLCALLFLCSERAGVRT